MTAFRSQANAQGHRQLITVPELLQPPAVRAACRTVDNARTEVQGAKAELQQARAALHDLDEIRTEQLAQAALAGRKAPDDTDVLATAKERVAAAEQRLRVALRAETLAEMPWSVSSPPSQRSGEPSSAHGVPRPGPRRLPPSGRPGP